MKLRFTLFVREHHTGWFTTSVLTLPMYTAYGPASSKLREELEEVLTDDLSSGTLILRGDHDLEGLERRAIAVELKAVQHGRLITVPMRFTTLVRPIGKPEAERFEVRIPRLDERFEIQGASNVEPWTEEVIRGHFRLKPVRALLEHQHDKAERIETLEITLGAKARAKKAAVRFEGGRIVVDEAHQRHPLTAFGPDLVHEAKEGRLARASHRDAVVDALFAILASKRAPSALVVGPSGAGKTAVISELAHQLAANSPGKGDATHHRRALDGTRIWHVTGMRMIAGAKYLGEWQARVAKIVDLVSAESDVLYVGNLLELVTSERSRSGLTVSQFLLPAIAAGELSVIAEATPDALAVAERFDAPFVRAFQRLPIPPLDQSLTTAVLEGAAERLAREHGVRWSKGAITAALDVVARFGDAESLPGSGLEVLGAMVRLTPADAKVKRELGATDAVRAFAKTSGFPEALLDPTKRLDLDEVRAFFTSRVIGQAHALELLTNVILLLKAGLNDPEKPLGSFLFMGPTGVGKTESALTLARYLFQDEKRLVRFDMSEYGYPGAALRLVDGPGGEGELTKAVRERPFSVLLFDEVEKADPGVFDVLLQVLGEGRLTDGTGRTVKLHHTIVILTSNLGAATRDPVGFDGAAQRAARLDKSYVEAASKFFRPELLNRIDHVVPFTPLDEASLRTIAKRLLDEALEREGLVRRGLTIERTPEVLDVLVREGWDPRYGARPMKRAVEAHVTVPLSRMLASGAAKPGSTLELCVEGGVITLAPRPAEG
ncbi:AAA family ATPase [Myxococcota bacterium]|nr:AAA family ATPase [Myxococcota bacterium]